MLDKYKPKSVQVVEVVFSLVLLGAFLGWTGLHYWAVFDCSPQAGKWTPWTGQVCYGEPK